MTERDKIILSRYLMVITLLLLWKPLGILYFILLFLTGWE